MVYFSPLQATLNSTTKGRTKIQKNLEKKKYQQDCDTFKISEDGRKSVRSLSGLQLGNDVMFLKQETNANPHRRIHVRYMFPPNPNDIHDDNNDDNVVVVPHAVSDPGLYSDPGQDSLFSRPGLGTLVFRRNYSNIRVQEAESYHVGEESLWREQNIHLKDRSGLRSPRMHQGSLQNRDLKVQKQTKQLTLTNCLTSQCCSFIVCLFFSHRCVVTPNVGVAYPALGFCLFVLMTNCYIVYQF